MKFGAKRSLILLSLIGTAALLLFGGAITAGAEETADSLLITGFVKDTQNQSVAKAEVAVISRSSESRLAEATTQADGRFTLLIQGIDRSDPPHLITVERAHFHPAEMALGADGLDELLQGRPLVLPELILQRRITPGFWLATLVFVAVLALIALNKLHNTLAALLGASLLFAVSYLGALLSEDLFVFDFKGALGYVDWNVIFLIMGMMIVIAVIERTGIFQWSAFMAYRISGGRTWLLLPILMFITGIASAFLDNVTTMLLMTPITIQIALSLGINPLAFLMPEVMASNVVGISTLVGTPTNILIGSFARISFTDFLSNLTPGVLMAMVGLIVYSELTYRRELKAHGAEGISDMLQQRLAERARITDPEHLKKAAVVGAAMILLFVFGESVHLIPAVTAVMGATALLVWIKPDIDEMIEAVDWTTLVFFIGLFICVGAVQEVGLISYIADGIGKLVGDNLVLAIFAVIWLSAFLSTVIANIPFTAAMLPVIAFLSATVPGGESKVLFYCLSVGSAMGGNGSLIGASANMVTSGIAERAGSPITYVYFLRKGFPAMLITLALATIWLLIRFA